MSPAGSVSTSRRPRRKRGKKIAIGTAWFAAEIAIITTAIFAFMVIPLQRDQLLSQYDSKANVIHSMISQVVSSAIVLEDFSQIVEQCMTVVNQNPSVVYVVITKRDGFSLVHTKTRWSRRHLDGVWRHPAALESGSFIHSDLIGDDVYQQSFPLRFSGLDWGFIHVGLSRESYQSDLLALWLRTGMLAALSIALGCALSLAYARRISRPIQSLAEFAERVRQGDLTARARVSTGDEIESLADSFNQMICDLHQSHAELETTHAKLLQNTRALSQSNALLTKEVQQHQETLKHLKKSEEKYRSILEQINDGYFEIDNQRTLQFFNRALCHMLACDSASLEGADLHEYVDEDFRDEFFQQLSQIRVTGKGITGFESQLTRKDMTRIGADISLSLMRDASGSPVGFRGLARDITNRKRLERRLAQGQKLESIGQLAAGIAHELNTPTQYVSDNTRFLSDSFEDLMRVMNIRAAALDTLRRDCQYAEQLEEMLSEEQQVDIEFLRNEIPAAIGESIEGLSRIAEIIRAIKDFAHPGSKEKATADLNAAIKTMITVTRNEWKHVADMETDLDPNLPLVCCVEGEIKQALLNLLINAAHAHATQIEAGTTEKGRIRVRTRYAPPWVEIRVRDRGGGIPEEILPRIFDPFFTTKEVGRGTGQGLAITHTIVVQNHGGTITCETEMGVGSEFTVRLPLNAQDGAPA